MERYIIKLTWIKGDKVLSNEYMHFEAPSHLIGKRDLEKIFQMAFEDEEHTLEVDCVETLKKK